MLHKKNRLAKETDLKAVFAKGRAFFNPFFSIKFLSRPQGKRFTVVVSTKIFKSAVKRNRLKRLVREFVRKNLNLFKNGDYTIIARQKISSSPEKQILNAFSELCSKVK